MGIKKGFTFIEIVVVIGVIGLALPALFAIVFAILQQQTKIMRLSEVKRQGDNVLVMIQNTIRNYATEIYSDTGLTIKECDSTINPHTSNTGSNFYLKDKYNNSIRFYLQTVGSDIFIASDSARPFSAPATTQQLTTNKVTITTPTNFISCQRSATYSPPIITINFKVQYKTTSTRVEDTASLNYQTSIKLRSY